MTPKIHTGIRLLLACLFLSSTGAFACSTASWTPGASGSVAVNDPANGVPSVGGGCGFMVTGVGHVRDNNPDTEAQFIGRFYFLPQLSGTGSTDIFVAYSDEASTELFSVKYDGSNISIDATAATGGSSASVAVSSNHWHLIEFKWTSGNTGSLWVNADATTDPASTTFSSGTGVVESIRLGAPNGFGSLTGMAFFDDYVSNRLQPVGGLLAGDGNSDEIFNSADIDAIVDQFLFDTYDTGVTDCTLDGEVNSGDVNCVVAEF